MLKVSKIKFDIEKLNKDLKVVLSLCNFNDSTYGHSICVMQESMCIDSHKKFHNNLPFYKYNMEDIPYIYELWKMFNSIGDVSSFRIMTKLPHTSYGIHNDKDAGDVIRMQIPIQTNKNCWLACTNLDEIEEGWTDVNTYFKNDLENRFGNDVQFFQMDAGYLYHFDTNKIHTLTNEGDTIRYTLLIDLLKNNNSIEFINNMNNAT